MLLKPKKINKGDTIAIISPSLPISSSFKKFYNIGKKELTDMGFNVKESKNCHKIKYWSGGTAQQRADDINSMFADNKVKAIIAQNGGYSAFSVLEHLDYNLIKKNPKPFIGFSDITNFHCAFYTKCNLVGFHMDMVTYNLGWVWNDIIKSKKNKARLLFLQALTQNKPFGKIQSFSKWQCWRKGNATGKLFGGNLMLLENLIGTQYFPSVKDLKGSILFWEVDKLPLFRIERALYKFKYAGILDVISGMIIGKLVDLGSLRFKEIKNPSNKNFIMEILNDYDFPVLANVDFGHKCINLPMFVGVDAEMNAGALNIIFKHSALS